MSEAQQLNPMQQWRIDAWFPELSSDIKKNLKIYFDEINKSNRAYNLVSPKTLLFADAIHFADAIIGSGPILKEIPLNSTIFDIGSGNGFPGLVMAILSPKHKFVLLDADQKKCDFLKDLILLLRIDNCEVKNGTIESLEMNSVAYGVTRGLANISKCILMLRKCFRQNGSLYHFKTEQWSNEVAEIPTQLCSIWFPSLLHDYKLPIGAFKFAIVKTVKQGK